jgi:methyltransferase (TIGR00027 family)
MEKKGLTQIRLDGISETLLIPLWARAEENRRPEPIVRDAYAEAIIKNMDYDFSRFERAWMSQTGVAVRTLILDRVAGAFLNEHPEALVINLGAGLDTRFFRLDNGRLHWFEVDLPEPVRIRRRFFKESSRYRILTDSVFEETWIRRIDPAGRAVLIIAEGLLMYFEETEVRDLLGNLVTAFPGAHMLFEMMTPNLVKRSRHHDAVSKTDAVAKWAMADTVFTWGIRSGREAAAYHPHIHFIEEWNYFDFHRDRWQWMGWLARIPAFKNRFNNRIVHLAFESEKGRVT